MDAILTLKVQPLPQVVLQPGPFNFSSYDVGLFVEPNEDWQSLTGEGDRRFRELCRRIAKEIRFSEKKNANYFLFPIHVGEYHIDAPRLFSWLFSKGWYFGSGAQIGGPVHAEARAPLRWLLAGLAAQKEAIAPGAPLKVFCVGGVLEDNLIYAANVVVEYLPGASVIIPVDYCAPSGWFDLKAERKIIHKMIGEPPAG